MNVREKLPVRRKTPTKSQKGKDYSKHKNDLRVDFHSHCGYCGSCDNISDTPFEVDHFVPKSLFEKNGNIVYSQYDNLVYSCKFCNNYKSSKWPTNDENIPNEKNKGFIDPCNSEYDIHLYRASNGSIMWNTDLGEWMAKEAFKFDERDFSIKILWELNQLRKAIESLIEELIKYKNNSTEYKEIKQKAEQYGLQYYLFHKELIEYYKSI